MRAAGMRGLPVLSVSLAVVLIVASSAPAAAELRISTPPQWVYLNDTDVTVQFTVLGAIPPTFTESIKSGIPSHVRFTVELWRYRRMWPDKRLLSKTIERQLVYNVLTKEFKVASLSGETREPYTSRELRDAQRVLSDLRGLKLLAASQLEPSELFYVRVRAETALSGNNTFLTRLSGEAEETPWTLSSLMTASRTQ